MSYTEIYGALTDGEVAFIGEAKNAWLGAMHVWSELSKKYGIEGGLFGGFTDLWKLADTGKLEDFENIVLKSTFDNVVVKKEDIPNLLKAFDQYDKTYPKSNLKEQAEIIKEYALENDVMTAVCWNQTSVNGNPWTDGYDEEADEEIPYNILKGDRHWYMTTIDKED